MTDIGYAILDKHTMYLSNRIYNSIPDAVKGFEDAWYIGDRNDRFTLTETALIDASSHRKGSYPILATFESLNLDYLQQNYPELLI